MNILIIADVYPPEISSVSHLTQELAWGFLKHGHQVTVATPYPKHYLNKEAETKSFKTVSIEDGIKVIRVRILPHHKVNYIIRGISQLTLPFLFFRKIKEHIKDKIDAVLISCPPLPLALTGIKVKQHYGAKFILLIQDIFPQNAVDIGVLRNKWLIKFFERMERKVYQGADKITFHSEGGKQFLINKKGVPSEKIITLYNWVDPAPYQNLTKDISFRKKYGLEEKFIFLFAGVIGPAQGLELLVEIAREVSDIKDIVFLVVGDGMEKEKIQKMIADYSLNNILIRPFVSKEEYPYLAKDTDVAVVCISSQNKTSFIPGKFLGYMAAGCPIVAFLNQESDAFPFIAKANCGYAVRSDNLDEAIKVVRKIYQEKDKLKQLGDNGLNFARDNLTVDTCIKKLEKLIKS